MASNAEMRRLVLHAADRLSQESDQGNSIAAIAGEGYATKRDPMIRRMASTAAAMALAEGTLRMVAACLQDDEPAEPDPEHDLLTFTHADDRVTAACRCGWISDDRYPTYPEARSVWVFHSVTPEGASS